MNKLFGLNDHQPAILSHVWVQNIYQARKIVFDQISKHLKNRQKYSAARLLRWVETVSFFVQNTMQQSGIYWCNERSSFYIFFNSYHSGLLEPTL